MLRDTVMVSQFGIGLSTDAYRIAVTIPDTIFMLIAGGGLSSAFIPVFSELINTDREEEAWHVFSVITTLCTLVATALVGIAWVFSPQIVAYFADKKVEAIPQAIPMSQIMLPAQIAFLVGSILLGTLYARKQFLAPGLAPNVYNLGIILGAAFLPRLAGLGIESMSWGALVGAIIGNLVLPAVAMVKVGSKFRPSLDLKAPGVRKFFALVLPVILGFSLPSMVNIITQKFASSFPEGVNTVLANTNNLMQAPLGIFGQSLALAAFPVLAEFVATNRMDLYRDQISRTLRTVVYLAVPSGALMLALSPEIVHLLYGWGKAAKSATELGYMTDCLRVYSVGVFAWCMQPVLMRGFFSLHKTLKPVAIGTVMTAVFIVICYASVHAGANFVALPWAANAAAALLAISLFFALEGDVGKLDRKGIASTLVKCFAAGVPMGGIAWALARVVHLPSKLGSLVGFTLIALIAAWAYYFVTRALKMPETEYLDRAMKKLQRKK